MWVNFMRHKSHAAALFNLSPWKLVRAVSLPRWSSFDQAIVAKSTGGEVWRRV